MNILLIGNCQILASAIKLARILNQIPDANIYLKFIFIPGSNIRSLNDTYNVSLAERNVSSVEQQNKIFTYIPGNSKYNVEFMPDTTIKDVVQEQEWDIILFNVSSRYVLRLIQNEDDVKKTILEFIDKLQTTHHGKIYLQQDFVPNYVSQWRKGIKEFVYPADYQDWHRFLNNFDDKIVQSNKSICLYPMRSVFEKLINALSNKNRLIVDHIHTDYVLGRYFCAAFFYMYFFYNICHIDLKDIQYTDENEKYYTYEDGTLCIPVNQKTKEICDNIIKGFINNIES